MKYLAMAYISIVVLFGTYLLTSEVYEIHAIKQRHGKVDFYY